MNFVHIGEQPSIRDINIADWRERRSGAENGDVLAQFTSVADIGDRVLFAGDGIGQFHSLAKGFQTIAAETTDYSKRSLETSSAYLEKLVGAKSLDNAIQIQSEYAKVAYEGFVAQTSKISELYANLAKEAFKPVETALATSQTK